MNVKLYYIDCLTNLHVGSGDANFNIVDKEVERDPITGDPIVHASGIKGALRDKYEERGDMKDDSFKKEVFGIFGAPAEENRSDTVGAYKFFDAHILYRPIRSVGSHPYVNVTTQTAINDFIDLTSAFGIDVGVKKLDISFPKDKNFLTSDDSDVEGDDSSERLDAGTVSALKGLLGEHFAIAKSLDDYGLPVIARNNLQGSGNLWYEEYVPHGSRFYMLAILPDGADASEAGKVIPEIAQVGGNSSIGYGYCSFRLCETNGGSK